MRAVLARPAVRLVAALAIVGSMVFATPSTALAAGPWTSVTVTAENPVQQTLDITCRFSLRQAGPGMPALDLAADGYCIGGPDITPGGTQAGEAGSGYTISVSGVDPDAVPCSGSTTGVLEQHPSNGTYKVAGAISATLISTGLPDCSITRVGVRFTGTNFDQVNWQTVNIPAIIEEPPAPGEGCPIGIPRAYFEDRKVAETEYIEHYQRYVVVTLPRGVSTARWGVAVRDAPTVQYYEVPENGQIFVSNHFVGKGNSPPAIPLTAGIEMWSFPDPHPIPWNVAPPAYGAAYDVANVVPTQFNHAFYGLTQPSRCRFYYGPKVTNLEGTDIDIPQADGRTPYVEPPDEPPPPIEQPVPVEPPGTDWGWLSALFEALLRAVGAVVTAIGKVAGAIMTGLRALFIPDQAEWGVEELVDQMKEKPPFSLVSSLEEEGRAFGRAYRDGGSCGVIANFGNGMQINCASIAGIPGMGALHNLVSAGLYGLTGWAIFNQISRLFEEGQ